MHVLGQYGKENAAAIFELFLECMPEYPLDKVDNEGNTGRKESRVLLLLYLTDWIKAPFGLNVSVLTNNLLC